MSEDKKSIIPPSSFQKRKRHCSAERTSKINLRRRNLYTQLSLDEREMLLSQRRAKNVQSVRPTLLVECTDKAFLSEIGVELPKQTTLRIEEPSSVTEKVANTSSANNPMVAFVDFNKGKNIDGPISVFEIGSTSTSQSRAKNVQSARRTFLVGCTERAFSSEIGVELPKQTTLRIEEPSSITKKVANKSCANNPMVAFVDFNKGKSVDGPVSVFETGSTSTGPTERHDLPTSIIIRKGDVLSCRVNTENCTRWQDKST